ncbi:hypothetical protein BG000_011727 [Podila horticola]|nr:hypothetical protein BG000_011727 [Podila horticola]
MLRISSDSCPYILCICAGLRSASLVDQLYMNANDVERLQSIFHHTARFNHLDLLMIGEDHVFIIHRQLLLQDIHDYLSGSTKGLQRVFVNIDYHLTQPEIMPANRYKALEDYIRHILLPNIQYRIQSWDLAEQSYEPLEVPHRLSIVTLTGWLLSYPINYVLPGHGRRYSSGTCSSSGALNYNSIILDECTQNCDDEEDEEQDDGRNALADQALVITSVRLGPNEQISELREHCFLSFSYPAELAERCGPGDSVSSVSSSTSSPLVSPLQLGSGMNSNDQGEEFLLTPTTPTPEQGQGMDRKMGTGMPTPPSNTSSPSMSKSQHRSSPSELSPRLPSSEYFDMNRPLPFSNPDICAAGRSFLTVLHSRFQQQQIWKTWQVGQQSATLPVVAM